MPGCLAAKQYSRPAPPGCVNRRRGAPTIRDPQGLFDGCGADLASDFILRAGATRAADRADQLAAFDQRNAASRADDAVEGEEVSVAALDSVLENLAFAAVDR